MLSAFKLKSFDLEPIYASWTDAPQFLGNPKKDLNVEVWLDQIKAGCIERKVPEEYWHKVAQHNMGEMAKGRLEELKEVMRKVQGGKYRWNWKKYSLAMKNMGWTVDPKKTETIKVSSKGPGSWWVARRENAKVAAEYEMITSKDLPKRPRPEKTRSDSMMVAAVTRPKPPTPVRSNTMGAESVTTVARAPTWLLDACNALEFLTSEHPKVMTTISAILITVGSIPAIPAIGAGAGGAVLASGAAHAVGAIAVAVGGMLQASQNGKLTTTPAETS